MHNWFDTRFKAVENKERNPAGWLRYWLNKKIGHLLLSEKKQLQYAQNFDINYAN